MKRARIPTLTSLFMVGVGPCLVVSWSLMDAGRVSAARNDSAMVVFVGGWREEEMGYRALKMSLLSLVLPIPIPSKKRR